MGPDFISSPILDTNAIPMDIPMFSGSGIPMEQVSTLYNQSGKNRKWKIQDGGLHNWVHIPQLPDYIASRSQQLYVCFRGRAFRRDKYQHCIANVEGTESGTCKMAA